MRAPLLASLLVAIGCKPDPLATASTVPERAPPVAQTAATGDPIVIEMLRPRLRITELVSEAGTVTSPICGEVSVAGRAAPEVCEAVATCLASAYRRAAVRVSIGPDPSEADRAGCDVIGPPKPEGWAEPSARVLAAAASADRLNSLLLVRAAEAASLLESSNIELTAAHPDIVAMRTRVGRLLDAAATAAPGDGAAVVRAKLAAPLAESEHAVAELEVSLGALHPDLRRATASREFLRAVDAALPDTEVVPDPAARAVDAVLAEADLEFLVEQARLGPKHPDIIAARARLARLPPAAGPTPACAQRVAAFDIRIAYVEGQRDRAVESARLDASLDALAVARARLHAQPDCRCLPDAAIPCSATPPVDVRNY